MKKTILWITVSQIIMWLVFFLEDYFDEAKHEYYFFISFFIIPALYVILYMIFKLKIADGMKDVRWKRMWLAIGIWTAETVLITLILTVLVINDMWIIKQAKGGWEHFLNGIEYPQQGFFGLVIVDVLLIVCELFDKRNYRKKAN